MLSGLLLGAIFAGIWWLSNYLQSRSNVVLDHNEIGKWIREHPNATKAEIQNEQKCIEIMRTANLSRIRRQRVKKWREANPHATPGDLASHILEGK